MFYWIYRWFSSRNGTASDETWVLLRAALAIGFSFMLVLLSGNRVIRWLLKQKVGDRPEFHHTNLNELMKHKGNTPTMGGIMIVGAILVTTALHGAAMRGLNADSSRDGELCHAS